jgi:hypothetical protein
MHNALRDVDMAADIHELHGERTRLDTAMCLRDPANIVSRSFAVQHVLEDVIKHGKNEPKSFSVSSPKNIMIDNGRIKIPGKVHAVFVCKDKKPIAVACIHPNSAKIVIHVLKAHTALGDSFSKAIVAKAAMERCKNLVAPRVNPIDALPKRYMTENEASGFDSAANRIERNLRSIFPRKQPPYPSKPPANAKLRKN